MHFLTLLSSLARYSQEPWLKRIFEILWVLFEKISVFYSDWPKSWIWQTLGHVRDIFCKCHFQNASKEVFRPKKNLNSIARIQKCHFARIEKLPKWHFWTRTWNSKFILAKRLLLKHYEDDIYQKYFPNMSQSPQNLGFRPARVENWDFLKKDSQDFKNSFQSGFLWIPRKTGKLNEKLLILPQLDITRIR